MLANTLNTNEIKNASGTEVEFQHLIQTGRTREFSQITEGPQLQHRLKISHQETGTGSTQRRRSVVRFTKEVAGVSGVERAVSAYAVLDIPIGDLSTYDEPKAVLAELMSFLASLGANTTILYDCTGNGASVLVNGGL
jgi:predicted AAA+ superfamily ATPase